MVFNINHNNYLNLTISGLIFGKWNVKYEGGGRSTYSYIFWDFVFFTSKRLVISLVLLHESEPNKFWQHNLERKLETLGKRCETWNPIYFQQNTANG